MVSHRKIKCFHIEICARKSGTENLDEKGKTEKMIHILQSPVKATIQEVDCTSLCSPLFPVNVHPFQHAKLSASPPPSLFTQNSLPFAPSLCPPCVLCFFPVEYTTNKISKNTSSMKKMGIIINNFRCALPLLFYLTVSLHSGSVSSELSQSQKNTMLNLSKLLHSQTSMISWNTNSDPCSSWSGVTCRNVTTTISSVSMLSFSNLDLTNSSFLPLACQIDTLESIDVSKNMLTSIPDGFFIACRRIQGLKSVNFSFNHVSGPLPSFSSGFTNLESLDLSYNSFSGSIGSQLSDLVSLKLLNLNFNAFSGSVPTKLGKSMVLEQLELSGNNFQRSIPEQLADYKNLTVLDLAKNKLTGNIPSRIGQLSKLEILVLSDNSLGGEVPDFISRIRTLKRFAANQNSFTGAIPSGISRFLKNLDLSYNNLSGSMPNDLLAQPNLQTVDLSYNKLKGSIPGNVSSSLVRLRLGSNALNGSISPFNCAQLQNLVYLELENNLLSGNIPTHLGSCWNLRLLSLGGNKFSGELPVELGNLKQLQVLSLQLNKFVGRIPHEITTLSHLSTLNISWNLLNGSIPPSITGLTNLAYLHLQGNNLSGVIPGSISDMNSLIELQLGKNQLSGYIPPMPRKLQYALNLSSNLFEGRIPESLHLLNSLEILDLSNNRFSGEIPKFLSKMESLTTVLLNNNNLSGVVPAFSPNVDVHFAGNPLLVIPKRRPPLLRHRVRLPAPTITALIAAVTAGGLIAIIAIFLCKRLIFRANDLAVQPRDEDYPLSQPVETLILTANSIHKSNIDFTKAIETVANPLNLVLTTRFSSYYKVIMPSGLSYFVKKLNLTDKILQPSSLENFGQKLRVLGKVNSTNIMTPLAFMFAGDSAYLFYETAFIGSLFDLLHGNCGIPLDWASRFSIAVGVAQGLTSLHGCLSGPILHFDLTSKTIMLKSPKQPQIGDIELYKVIDPSKSTSSLSAVAGSIGYIPPEYAYTMKVTMEGNVYSFGVILLELVTGKLAVSEGMELAKWVSSSSIQQQKWEQILDFSISQTSLAIRSQMLAVLKVALDCTNATAEARPKMKSVLRMLLNAR